MSSAVTLADAVLGRSATTGNVVLGHTGEASRAPLNEVNKWADLENATVTLHAERDALQAEVSRLHSMYDSARAASASPAPPAADLEVSQLQILLEEAKQQATARLSEVIAERGKATALAQELEVKTRDMAEMSSMKLQLQYDKNAALAELQPAQEERDRLRRERQETQMAVEQSRSQLSSIAEQHDKSIREASDLRRELTQEAASARTDAAFYQRIADEAREGQKAARQQAASAEQRMHDQAEGFAEERAGFETKVCLLTGEIKNTVDQYEDAKDQLVQALREKDATVEAKAAVLCDVERYQDEISNLKKELDSLKADHEALLEQNIPGGKEGKGALPAAFPTLVDMVVESKASREEARRERQKREQIQHVLQEIEREVRGRYPALLRQCEEAERLRPIVAQLGQENEHLSQKLQDFESRCRSADSRARQAERSEEILKAHAQDITEQLAVLVHENRRLSAGTARNELRSADDCSFRNVRELTEQNVKLRKALVRLTQQSETAAQHELQKMRDEQEQQEGEWKKHLAEKAEHMQALAEAVAQTTQQRDEAQAALKAHRVAPARDVRESDAVVADVPRVESNDQALHEQLSALRNDIGKLREGSTKEVKDLRSSEVRAKQELGAAKGKLELELSRRKSLEVSLQQKDKELEDRQMQIERVEQRQKALEEKRRKEEAIVRDAERAVAQTRRESEQKQEELIQVRRQVGDLEKSNAALAAEKAGHMEIVADLHTRLAREGDVYKEMKRDLGAAFQQQEKLLQEKLELAMAKGADMQRRVDDLTALRAAGEQELRQAKASIAHLQRANVDLEKQVHHCTEQIREIGERKSVVHSGVEVDMSRLEGELSAAIEREGEYAKSAEKWKTIIAMHENDLKARSAEIADLRSEAQSTKVHMAKLEEEAEKLRQREQQLDTRSQDLVRKAAELQACIDKKDAEAAAIQLAGEEKIREASSQVERNQREIEGARARADESLQKHNSAVQDHRRTIAELDTLRMRHAVLEKETKELRQRVGDLAGEADRARAERADEVDTLKQRLDHELNHTRTLTEETRKYQEHLLVMSGQHSQQGTSQEATQQVAAELRRTREIAEKKQQELEVVKERLDRGAKALREELVDLQRRFDEEQRKVMQLEAEVRREQRVMSKMGQLCLLEDENRRMTEKLKTAEAQLDAMPHERAQKQAEAEPLSRDLQDLKRKEVEWERKRTELEATCDEWKRLHDEVAQKFDAKDIKEFKRLKEEAGKWTEKNAELTSLVETLKKEKDQMQKTTRDTISLKQLHLKKIETLEAENKKSEIANKSFEEERKKIQEQLRKAQEERQKAVAEAEKAIASSKKNEEEVRTAQQRSDRAMSVAMDYQRAASCLIVENKEAEDRESRDRARREARERDMREAHEREAREREAQEVEAREREQRERGVAVSTGITASMSRTDASTAGAQFASSIGAGNAPALIASIAGPSLGADSGMEASGPTAPVGHAVAAAPRVSSTVVAAVAGGISSANLPEPAATMLVQTEQGYKSPAEVNAGLKRRDSGASVDSTIGIERVPKQARISSLEGIADAMGSQDASTKVLGSGGAPSGGAAKAAEVVELEH